MSVDNDRFEYIAGVYYQKSDLLVSGVTDTATGPTTPVGGAFNSAILNMTDGTLDIFPEHSVTSRFHELDQESTTIAVFAQLGVGITDDLKFELSARYSDEEKEGVQLATLYGGTGDGVMSGQPISNVLEAQFWQVGVLEVTPHSTELTRKESHFTPSATLTWSANKNANWYVSYSEGVKGGGFNSFAMTDDPEEAEYEEEKAASYEVGGKFSLLGGAASLNVSVFDTQFDDMQTTQFTGGTTFVVANAAKASSRGVELEFNWLITDEWSVNANAGYLDFAFDSYVNSGCTAMQIADGGFVNGAACSAAGANDLSGRTNQDSPQVTASASLEYATMIGEFELISLARLSYTDDFYAAADLDEDSLVESFTLFDLSVRLASPDQSWDVTFIGRNLTDQTYFYYHNDTPLLTGSHQAAPASPATYTLQFSYYFVD